MTQTGEPGTPFGACHLRRASSVDHVTVLAAYQPGKKSLLVGKNTFIPDERMLPRCCHSCEGLTFRADLRICAGRYETLHVASWSGTMSDQKRPVLPWKTLVQAEIERLSNQIEVASTLGPRDPRASAALTAARTQLEVAKQSLIPRKGWSVLWTWASGTDQEGAWLSIHAADTHLAYAVPEDDLKAELPPLHARAISWLGRKSTLYLAWKPVLTAATPSRSDIAVIKRYLYALSDRSYERLRSFRNILVGGVIALVVATSAAAILGTVDSGWIPLCPTSPSATAGTAANAEAEGNSGDADQTTPDADHCPVSHVWEVEALGALGGLVAAIGALTKLRGFRNPYNLPLVQAALKVPMGALTGLVGVILVQSGSFLIDPQTGNALIAYAVFFGAAQELVTRLVDRKAGEIADQANPSPSKEPNASSNDDAQAASDDS